MLEEIANVPITHVFGNDDHLADFEFQKELMYKVSAEQTIKFLPAYDHFAFLGNEPNDKLQKIVFAAFNGNKESDSAWTDFLQEKADEEAEEAAEALEKANRKGFGWIDWLM